MFNNAASTMVLDLIVYFSCYPRPAIPNSPASSSTSPPHLPKHVLSARPHFGQIQFLVKSMPRLSSRPTNVIFPTNLSRSLRSLVICVFCHYPQPHKLFFVSETCPTSLLPKYYLDLDTYTRKSPAGNQHEDCLPLRFFS
jgi:hypothetical protein